MEVIQEAIIRGKEFKVKIGPPRLTKYEKARILGARALQLALGAPILIELDDMSLSNPLKIAKREMELGVLPIIVRRKSPSGRYQDIPIRFLLNIKP